MMYRQICFVKVLQKQIVHFRVIRFKFLARTDAVVYAVWLFRVPVAIKE